MSEELKLKPCPLCGGKADFWGGAGAVLAGCSKCNIHTIYCYPPKDAARVWNSRPAEDEKIVRIAELEDTVRKLTGKAKFRGDETILYAAHKETTAYKDKLIAKLKKQHEIDEKRIAELELALSRMMDEKEIACQEAVEARIKCLLLEKKLKEAENREN